jgi:hypothetical protein
MVMAFAYGKWQTGWRSRHTQDFEDLLSMASRMQKMG